MSKQTKRFGAGTVSSEPICGLTVNCMAPDHRDCLDRAMAEWKEHKKQLPKKIGKKRYVPGVYGFAYWLIRWSGLVQPVDQKLCACGKPAGPTGLCGDCFLSRNTSGGSILRPRKQ